MPVVSDEFITHAKRLATGIKQALARDENIAKTVTEQKTKTAQTLRAKAELTAETLVNNGLVPAQQKTAAVTALLDHAQALDALNQTAQFKSQAKAAQEKDESNLKEAHSMGIPISQSGQSNLRESDRALMRGLGFQV